MHEKPGMDIELPILLLWMGLGALGWVAIYFLAGETIFYSLLAIVTAFVLGIILRIWP